MFPVILKYIKQFDKTHGDNVGIKIIPKIGEKGIADKVEPDDWDIGTYKKKYIEIDNRKNWDEFDMKVNIELKRLNKSRKGRPQIHYQQFTPINYPGKKKFKETFTKMTVKLPNKWVKLENKGIRIGPEYKNYTKNPQLMEEDSKYYTVNLKTVVKGQKCIAPLCKPDTIKNGICYSKTYKNIKNKNDYIKNFCNIRPSLFVIRPNSINTRELDFNSGEHVALLKIVVKIYVVFNK